MPKQPKKSTHGGKRPGAGKKAPDGVRKARTVKLNAKEHKYINDNYGSLTVGVRTVLLKDMK